MTSCSWRRPCDLPHFSLPSFPFWLSREQTCLLSSSRISQRQQGLFFFLTPLSRLRDTNLKTLLPSVFTRRLRPFWWNSDRPPPSVSVLRAWGLSLPCPSPLDVWTSFLSHMIPCYSGANYIATVNVRGPGIDAQVLFEEDVCFILTSPWMELRSHAPSDLSQIQEEKN